MKRAIVFVASALCSVCISACDGHDVQGTLDRACDYLHDCDDKVDVKQCRAQYAWKSSYDVCDVEVVHYYDCKMGKGCGYWDNYNRKMSQCKRDDDACIDDVMKTNACAQELADANKCLYDHKIVFLID